MPKTAYGHLMDDERRKAKERDPKRRTARRKKEGAACGAKKKGGGTCGLAAGWGTTHQGIGKCRNHGGNTPSHRGSAAKKKAIMMGAPLDINPLDGLIWCIKITAGEVQFCTQQLEMLNKEEWLEHTLIGKQVHVWAKERQRAVDRLAKYCKEALALGIAERAVRLAEQYGTSIARYTRGLLEDLDLSTEQKKLAPVLVRKHLALLEGGAPVQDEDRRHLPAIPARVA